MPYLVIMHPASSNSNNNNGSKMSIILHRRSTDATVLRAFVHVLVTAALLSDAASGCSLQQRQTAKGDVAVDGGRAEQKEEREVRERAEAWMDARFDRFVDAVSWPPRHTVSY